MQIDNTEFFNLRQRTEYVESLNSFITEQLAKAKEKRKDYTLNTPYEKRYNDFMLMHGYPLCDYDYYKNEPIAVKEESYFNIENMNITRMQLELIPGIWSYGMLYCPKNINLSQKNPFVIAQHGGDGSSEIIGSLIMNSANYNHMVNRLTDRGLIVFAPQQLLWKSEHYGSPYNREKFSNSLRQLGGSLVSLELLLLKRIIDYFENKPYINDQKMGIVGLSWGGMYALHLSAADPRIKATLSSCFFNDRSQINCTEWTNNNQAKHFFDAEVASLIIPRFLCVECGNLDELFPVKDSIVEAEVAQLYYKNKNCDNNFYFYSFDGGHEFNAKNEGLDWFFSKL